MTSKGEPLYGERDVADLEKIKALGLPFWLAGGHGKPGHLAAALQQGAAGIQVGTALAFCDLACVADADCASLGGRRECQSGYCRETGSEAPVASPDPTCTPGPLAAGDLIVIGDSLLTLSIFTSELQAVAVETEVEHLLPTARRCVEAGRLDAGPTA